MRRISSILLVSLALLAGCATIPKSALILSPESLAERQMQTRKYETKDEAKILAACAGLLQDLGFNLDESESQLGLITASKMRSAVNAGQMVTSILLSALGGTDVAYDREQKMRASVVTRPVENGNYIAVRVTFQRIVWDTNGQVSKSESLKDPKIYREFFSRLSKAIFLEAQEI
jgi:hypothetical protein